MRRATLAIAAGLTVLGLVTIGTSGVASAVKPKLPSIREVLPEHGPIGGGTTVEIIGRNLGGVLGVSFGTTPSPLVTPVSQFAVFAVSPAGSGTADVNVTTGIGIGTGAAVPADQFTYVTTPAIRRVAPSAGTTLGGNRVTITGSDFTGASTVLFGSIPGTAFTVESDQEIIATSPAEGEGPVAISVTGPDGTTPVDLADVYTYSLRVPVVTSVAPDVDPASGATTVTITGRLFKNVLAVDFGSTPAASYAVTSPRTITVVSPPVPV